MSAYSKISAPFKLNLSTPAAGQQDSQSHQQEQESGLGRAVKLQICGGYLCLFNVRTSVKDWNVRKA